MTFFTGAFLWARLASLMMLRTRFCNPISSRHHTSSYFFSQYLAHLPSMYSRGFQYSSSFFYANKVRLIEPITLMDTMHAFLPFNPISPPYTSIYHFTAYLSHLPRIYLGLFFTFRLVNEAMSTNFHVLSDRPFFCM